MESLSWRQSTYSRTSSDDSLYLPLESHRSNQRRLFSGRNSSQDSLYVPVNSSQNIKRWNGVTREAVNWNSLPRDPELFFPTGNCLVYLYPVGHSQRGPSFRIPYYVLRSSGCQPLVQQCLVSTLNISSSDRDVSKSLSHGTVSYSISEDTRTYLYLYPPAGLSRDQSYSYHITTRNFFAWLLGVPLVGTDPVSALLSLKARMDVWRDPNANNFEAVFKYARQQAYGDFEEIQTEMDKQTQSEKKQASTITHPLDQGQTVGHKYRHTSSIVRRNDSLKQKLRSTISRTTRSHIALQDRRLEQASLPAEKRHSLPRLATFSTTPAVPATAEIDRAVRRMNGPTRAQSSNAITRIQASEMTNAHRYTSRSSSISPVSPITPTDSNGIDAALQRLTRPPSADSVVTVSNSQVTKANKKKHRVSWADNNPTVAEARSSQTDLTYSNMQGFGLQSAQASSSAININQPSPVIPRMPPSMPLSSNPVAGPSKRASTPASSTMLPWGEEIRVARPMSTASLISIPTVYQGLSPTKLEPCSCCGKSRRPDTASVYQHQKTPRPASAHSLKSFQSTKSWRSLRSIRSSLSLHSIRSSMSLSSIRSYLSRKSAGKKSFADIQASMKDRRRTFRARLKKDKKQDLEVDTEKSVCAENVVQSCNPVDSANPRLQSRYRRASLTALSPAPVELEAEPIPMKTVPELSDTINSPWSADSYSDSLLTPPEDEYIIKTSTIRPKEIYTSGEYRYQPAPRRTANVNALLRFSDDQDPHPDSMVLDIGTPGGFEEDFVDTLITQLEAAGMSDGVTGKSMGKGKGKARADDFDEGGVWMGMMSSGIGMPGLEVRAMG